MLISYLVGVDMRTTMDIDTTMSGISMSEEGVRHFIEDVIDIDVDDGVTFTLKSIETIMEDADYPGLRVNLEAHFEATRTPVKIDISTGHTIYPRAIEKSLDVMFDEPIDILTYPVATIVAEKLHSVLSRGVANTRMRDFYDLAVLSRTSAQRVSDRSLTQAVTATFEHRGSGPFLENPQEIVAEVENSNVLHDLWKRFQDHNSWARGITFSETIEGINFWLNRLA